MIATMKARQFLEIQTHESEIPIGAFLVTQTVKTLAAMQESQVCSLGQEDPLEKEMATHSSILAWEVPRTEEPWGLHSMGSQRVGHNVVTKEEVEDVFILID